jgi:hypothetical protein
MAAAVSFRAPNTCHRNTKGDHKGLLLYFWRAEQDALAKVIQALKAWLNTEDPRLLADVLSAFLT